MYGKWLTMTAFAVGLTAHLTTHVYAQQTQNESVVHAKMAVEHGELMKLMQELNPTPDQVHQAHAVMHAYFQGIADLKTGTPAPIGTAAKKAAELRQQAEASFRKIMTPKQLAILETHGGLGILLGGSMGGPMEMLAKLNLTPAQSDQVKQIIENAHRSMSSLKQDSSLKPEEAKLKAEQLHQSAMREVYALLSPAQKKTFLKLTHGMGGPTDPPRQ